MANALYDSGRNAFLNGSVNWAADTIKAQLVSIINQPTAYVVDLANNVFFASVPTGARVGATSASLVAKTAAAGVADSNDTVFSAVSGPTVSAVVLYKDAGGAATANLLIAYIDTATGLPVGPNGGDITAQWDNTANKIFKL